MTKNEIADILTEIAVLLELKGENPFKTRAYLSGAKALESLEEDLTNVIAEARLQEIKGIGEALSKKIIELNTTGRLRFYDELKASIPPGLVEMLDIPGLGAKKIIALNQKLGITSIAELAKACADGLVAGLPGFGEKTQEKIVAGIKNREAYGKRHIWWDAFAVAEPILAGLRTLPDVQRAEHAGSLRRGMETVGDLDFIVAASKVAPVVEWFTTREGVKEVTAKGETKASVRYESGLQADLRIVPLEQFAFALHHFTGSKDHNVQMRQRALARGLSLSEWGLVPAEGEGTVKEKVSRGGKSGENTAPTPPDSPAAAGASASPSTNAGAVAGSLAAKSAAGSNGGESVKPAAPAPRNPGKATGISISTEEELFRALDLPFIPPELREGLGEIEAAEGNFLPKLVEYADLRGAFHNHTTASDGRNTLSEMVGAAEALGWEYFGIADHSKASFQANGLTEERLLKQVEDIRNLNTSKRFKTWVFTGTECDILADGRLDFDDATLAKLDYVVASVHNAFAQSEDEMTKRIIRALEGGRVTMLGHLTGRLLQRREGYPVNTGKIVDAAIANKVVIELNASPWRLDMDWRHWRRAAERGVLCSINPDAHETGSLTFVKTGVNAARKGWLTKEQVVNTKPLAEMKAWLAARK
ncbi:MAG TPA: helix-hairpin-helix domain-containing protein [Opitutaceae bacterium]|nr:helix-hairpin-helix domain-containing protein [Opitutaceae bacterium]